MITLTKLLLAHIIGDFFLQKKEWVDQKRVKKWKAPFLYIHSLFHFLLIILLFWDVGVWPAALFVAGLHLVIDGSKLSLQNSKNEPAWFIGDQLAHLVVIVTAWFLFWDEAAIAAPGGGFWVVLAGALFLINPVSFLMKQLMSRWTNQLGGSDTDTLDDAGRYIGILERLMIYAAVLSGYTAVIGFLLAAKSIFRFGDLTRAEDIKLTEYIVIGTLLSFLLAMVTGFAVVSLAGLEF